jgi:hypothetical protein
MLDFSPGSELAVLFHKAWGQAQAGSEYDKAVWRQLDKMLVQHGCGSSADPSTVVTIHFPTRDAAGSFVAYMSDGGGEQGFLTPMDDVIAQGDLTEADRVTSFDYSRGDTTIVAS